MRYRTKHERRRRATSSLSVESLEPRRCLSGKYPVTFALSSTSGSTNPSLTIRDIEQITIAS